MELPSITLPDLPAAPDQRCVIVVDEGLPTWLLANSTAVLGVALGAHGHITLGPDVTDREGGIHPGIGKIPLPILAAGRIALPLLREKAIKLGLTVLDFNSAAQLSRTYPEYERRLQADHLEYLGLALFGAAKAVTSLTGNLKGLR